MIFFAISLSILILAQCSYSMAFAFRFDTIDQWNLPMACCTFLCCLPFGTLVAFVMYFAENANSSVANVIQGIGLRSNDPFYTNAKDNKMMKWIRSKLNKHLGFILEAVVEAFPQSLLQIIAIVYFQEANYVSIISILLSMFSVTSKSLILSQGIEKYTFIWTWLCLVTDFFGIFFTLTWVFYSNDMIGGDFLGYFSIFGKIWIYKFIISTLSIVAAGCLLFWCFGYWVMGLLFCCDSNHESRCSHRFGEGCLWFVLAPLACVLMSFAASLACEVFCFSILAFAIYKFSTKRFTDYRSEDVYKIIHYWLRFIANGKDKKLRILAINRGLNEFKSNNCKTLSLFIDNTLEKEQYEGLEKISYSDMRKNCSNPMYAAFFADQWENITDEWIQRKGKVCGSHGDCADCFFEVIHFTLYTSIAFIFAPILLISKVVQIFYPWFIIAYLFANDLLFSGKIDTFQLVMLLIYIGLQLVLLFVGIYVFKIHFWLRHIMPGNGKIYFSNNAYSLDVETSSNITEQWYESVCWFPKVKVIIMNKFGRDVGPIIMNYCRSFELHEIV